MPSNVRVKYNACIPSLNVLVNGKRISEYSRLVRYMDEPIEKWIGFIFDDIYLELKDEYILDFIGNEIDYEVVKAASKKYRNCIGVKYEEPEINISIQEKLIKLNQLIKRAGISQFDRTIIKAFFIIDDSYSFLKKEIANINIKNIFCDIKILIIESEDDYVEDENSVLFIIVGEGYKTKLKTNNLSFMLYVGNKSEMISVENNIWCFNVAIEEVIDIIFKCFLQHSLMNAFRKCVCSIKEGKLVSRKLETIVSDEPVIIISLKNEVEEGKSVKLNITYIPELIDTPKLCFTVSDNNVAYCDGLNVHGINQGRVTLYAHKIGSEKAFYQKDMLVYRRNRITKIILDEDYLVIGQNEKKKISMNYFPENADNEMDIVWKSSNENVASVDDKGNIKGISEGECRIIVSAENISAQCKIRVKPLLEKINFDFELDTYGNIHLHELQEQKIRYNTYPVGSIDEELIFKTTNTDVCNVIDKCLYAKKQGETVLYIQNITGRIRYSFNIIVEKEERKNKESLFFKLFH